MNSSAKIHLTPAKVKGKYVIRFVANQENCNEEQVEMAWKTIQDFASEILAEITPKKKRPAKPALRKLDRTHSQRFSFTRNVSQELYERQSSM
jgi:tyrosine decarboxylase